MSNGGAANNFASNAKLAFDKGGMPFAVVVAGWMIASGVKPMLADQADSINATVITQGEEVTESIDRFAQSQGEHVNELNATVKGLASSMEQTNRQLVNIDTRLRGIEVNDIPRIDGRLLRLEGDKR